MRGRKPNWITMQADATYEIEKAEARAKGIPHTVTLAIIERRYKLKPGRLTSWRNNQFAPCKSQARRRAYYERKKHETRITAIPTGHITQAWRTNSSARQAA